MRSCVTFQSLLVCLPFLSSLVTTCGNYQAAIQDCSSLPFFLEHEETKRRFSAYPEEQHPNLDQGIIKGCNFNSSLLLCYIAVPLAFLFQVPGTNSSMCTHGWPGCIPTNCAKSMIRVCLQKKTGSFFTFTFHVLCTQVTFFIYITKLLSNQR